MSRTTMLRLHVMLSRARLRATFRQAPRRFPSRFSIVGINTTCRMESRAAWVPCVSEVSTHV